MLNTSSSVKPLTTEFFSANLDSLSFFLWFLFPIVNHSVLTVAASLLLTPLWLVHVASNCTAWFSQICCDRTHRSWVFFRGEQSILGRSCCSPRDDHEGVWAFWLPQQLLCEQLWLLGQVLPSDRLSWTRAVYKKNFPHNEDIITTPGTSQALWGGVLVVMTTATVRTVRLPGLPCVLASELTVSINNCCGRVNVISDKRLWQFRQSQARTAVASKNPAAHAWSMANTECSGGVVG